ncbi:hypothetical protein OH77DRAFT_1262419 [Trametes cingulata]|nr:hypothetical protein OH77DRAFT_1262419 [Trametes cingulata]
MLQRFELGPSPGATLRLSTGVPACSRALGHDHSDHSTGVIIFNDPTSDKTASGHSASPSLRVQYVSRCSPYALPPPAIASLCSKTSTSLREPPLAHAYSSVRKTPSIRKWFVLLCALTGFLNMQASHAALAHAPARIVCIGLRSSGRDHDWDCRRVVRHMRSVSIKSITIHRLIRSEDTNARWVGCRLDTGPTVAHHLVTVTVAIRNSASSIPPSFCLLQCKCMMHRGDKSDVGNLEDAAS